MKMIYQYKLPYKLITEFKYLMYDNEIGVISYQKYITVQLPYVISTLNFNSSSRQALMTINNPGHMSCLISIQFQINKGILYVTFNLRSQAVEYRKYDEVLFNYIVSEVLKKIKVDVLSIDILVNVGNYHSINDYNYHKTKMNLMNE